jgi:hypothetical protein
MDSTGTANSLKCYLTAKRPRRRVIVRVCFSGTNFYKLLKGESRNSYQFLSMRTVPDFGILEEGHCRMSIEVYNKFILK